MVPSLLRKKHSVPAGQVPKVPQPQMLPRLGTQSGARVIGQIGSESFGLQLLVEGHDPVVHVQRPDTQVGALGGQSSA